MSSVETLAPLKPPRAWFERPEANEPTPITFAASGEVYGHLALWDSCHSGFMAECVKPPRSPSNYSFFHVGEIETEEGGMLPVGKIVYSTDHASVAVGMQAAARHYADTGSVGAFVRARDGRFGPWLSGALRSDLSPEGLRDLRANPLSGDWRPVERRLELVAALAVPVPGFPIPRAQLALSASGEFSALILPALSTDEVFSGTNPEWEESRMSRVEYRRRRDSLVAAVLTTEARDRLPRSSFAIPSKRAYPIHDEAHARAALSRVAQFGTSSEKAQVRRAVCRRYPSMCRD